MSCNGLKGIEAWTPTSVVCFSDFMFIFILKRVESLFKKSAAPIHFTKGPSKHCLRCYVQLPGSSPSVLLPPRCPVARAQLNALLLQHGNPIRLRRELRRGNGFWPRLCSRRADSGLHVTLPQLHTLGLTEWATTACGLCHLTITPPSPHFTENLFSVLKCKREKEAMNCISF